MAEDRTEHATPKRRQDAREKGQVAKSAELNSATVLITSIVAVKAFGPVVVDNFKNMFANLFMSIPNQELDPHSVQNLFFKVLNMSVIGLAPILLAIMVGGVVANIAQVGFFSSLKPLVPTYSRIDPLKGFTRLFSSRTFVELLKSVLKACIVGLVSWNFIKGEYNTLETLGGMDTKEIGGTVLTLAYRLGIRVCGVLIAIAAADYIYQRFQFEKSIKMTKQEIKDEFKRSEGDPLIKSRIRSKHRQMAQRRMMHAVPTADVVVTNPTHYAVALKYDPKEMSAPRVVAKGQRLIARKIKEIAKKHNVPTVENVPLAQALFKSVEIGQEVPEKLYKAVAEVLAFVYKLNKKLGRR